jgi:hypothetical protein
MTWDGSYDEGLFTASGGSRLYTVVKVGESGPDQYPWALLPPYAPPERNKGGAGPAMRYTNPSHAMEGAELWENDPALFYAMADGVAGRLMADRRRQGEASAGQSGQEGEEIK